MTGVVTIERIEMSDTDAHSRIVAPLAEPATRGKFAYAPRFVMLALSDDEGVDGGLIGKLYWDWLSIETVAVPERWRGQGLGRRLLEQAETIALAEGCHSAWVDTYSFQSPGFYEAMGYRPFGRLADYPMGEERIFYAKALAGSPMADDGMGK
ncbi:MAG TPA: GNAT family N-acetyltransferase [Aurantimonas sp.]